MKQPMMQKLTHLSGMWMRILSTVLSLLFCASVANAEDNVSWHGFFTTGIVFSDSDQSYKNIERRPDVTKYTKFGLNLTSQVDEQWRFAGQIVAKRAHLVADWAFLGYRPLDWAEFRIGRVKLPAWAISDYIDVGRTYLWVEPPQEVYDINPINAVDGISFGFSKLFGTYEWTFELVGGNVNDVVGETTITGQDLVTAVSTFGNEAIKARVAAIDAQVSFFTDQVAISDIRVRLEAIGIFGEWKNLIYLMEAVRIKGHVSEKQKEDAERDAAAAASKAAQTGDAKDVEAAARAGAASFAFSKTLLESTSSYATLGYRFDSVIPHFTYAMIDSPRDSFFFGSQSSIKAGIKYEFSPFTDVKVDVQKITPKKDSTGLDTSRAFSDGRLQPLTIYGMTFNQVF